MPLNAPVAAFSSQDALVAVMVGVSASDANPTARELMSIQRMIDTLPVFVGYDRDRLQVVGRTVFDLFTEEDGLDALFGLVRDALPGSLRETAYALACDVGAADGRLYDGEIAMLAEIRHQLNIPRLHAAAIELSAQVRHRVL